MTALLIAYIVTLPGAAFALGFITCHLCKNRARIGAALIGDDQHD